MPRFKRCLVCDKHTSRNRRGCILCRRRRALPGCVPQHCYVRCVAACRDCFEKTFTPRVPPNVSLLVIQFLDGAPQATHLHPAPTHPSTISPPPPTLHQAHPTHHPQQPTYQPPTTHTQPHLLPPTPERTPTPRRPTRITSPTPSTTATDHSARRFLLDNPDLEVLVGEEFLARNAAWHSTPRGYSFAGSN